MYNNKIKRSIFSIEFRDVIVQLKFSLNSICEIKLTIIAPQLSKSQRRQRQETKIPSVTERRKYFY